MTPPSSNTSLLAIKSCQIVGSKLSVMFRSQVFCLGSHLYISLPCFSCGLLGLEAFMDQTVTEIDTESISRDGLEMMPWVITTGVMLGAHWESQEHPKLAPLQKPETWGRGESILKYVSASKLSHIEPYHCNFVRRIQVRPLPAHSSYISHHCDLLVLWR